MKIGVVIPCHNPNLDELSWCLSSIAPQLNAGEDRVLIVDDASREPIRGSGDVEMLRLGVEVGGCEATNVGLRFLAPHVDWVHVLHPDDWVLKKFYATVKHMTAMKPHLSLVATNTVYVDEAGRATQVQDPTADVCRPLHLGNPLEVPACVVSAAFAMQHPWNETLCHTADWEHHIRACMCGGGANVGWPLAVRRIHDSNHTSRLAREAENLRDHLRLAEIVKEYAPDLVEMVKFRSWLAAKARAQERVFRNRADFASAECNARFARELESSIPPGRVVP